MTIRTLPDIAWHNLLRPH